jgi:hypothetical protein
MKFTKYKDEQLDDKWRLLSFTYLSLEDAVRADTEDEKTIEHWRLSQCDRTQAHTEELQSKQRV